MEIGPIPGIRPVSVLKSPPSDPRLPAVIDVEHPSPPEDDTYSGSQSAAGGEDDQEEMNDAADVVQDGQEEMKEAEQPELPASPNSSPNSSIDLLA